jgi:hypothetical protein
VVSEESGRISLARHGRLQAVEDPGHLEELLSDFLAGASENGK